ncbi:hypothetical protein HDV03_003084 [Kappamyces sp. JEL0829]|nr:hypothetical protein HDV03_003084 [Kappamyces sp. JEL0829]
MTTLEIVENTMNERDEDSTVTIAGGSEGAENMKIGLGKNAAKIVPGVKEGFLDHAGLGFMDKSEALSSGLYAGIDQSTAMGGLTAHSMAHSSFGFLHDMQPSFISPSEVEGIVASTLADEDSAPIEGDSVFVPADALALETPSHLVAAKRAKKSKAPAGSQSLQGMKSLILTETKNVASFVVIGETLDKLYYKDKLVKNQKEFLEWTKTNLGFSKSTTYEYIISYRVPSEELAQVWMEVHDSCEGVITTAVLEAYLAGKNFVTVKERKQATPRKKRQQAAPAKKSKRKRRGQDSDDTEDDIYSEPSDHEADYVVPKKERAPLLAVEDSQLTEEQANAAVDEYATGDSTLSGSLFESQASTVVPASHGANQWLVDSTQRESTPEPELPQLQAVALTIQKQRTPPRKRAASRTIPLVPAYKSAPPFDIAHVFEVAQRVVSGQEFDKVCHTVGEFEAMDESSWFGRLFCDLSSSRPIHRTLSMDESGHSSGIERLLQSVFTRFANKDYTEGIFVIRGEFGADWFTPILQHPMCILRQQTSRTLPIVASPSFDSYVAFYMGPNVAEFCHQFRLVGFVPGFNCWSYSQKTESPLMQRSLSLRNSQASEKEADLLNTQDFLNDEQSGDNMDLEMPMHEDLSVAASVLCNFST